MVSGKLFGITILLLGLVAHCYSKSLSESEVDYFKEHAEKWKIPTVKTFIDGHKKVAGGENVTEYVYISDAGSHCKATVTENVASIKIVLNKACANKRKKEGRVMKEESMELPMSAIEHFQKHAGEWMLPRIKAMISGHKKVKGGTTETHYVYTSDDNKHCKVTIIEENEDIKISRNRSCVKKFTDCKKGGKMKKKKKTEEKDWESMALSEKEIKYFEKHAGEWMLPGIKTLISGHKKVRGGKTETHYVYTSDDNKNCKVTIIEVNDDIKISRNRSCFKNVIDWKKGGNKKKGEKEEEEWVSKALSETEIGHFEKHAGEWMLPNIKTLIDGHKTVKGRKTEIHYVYTSDDDQHCTVTIMEDNESVRISRNRSCVKKVHKGPKEGKSKKKEEEKEDEEDEEEKEEEEKEEEEKEEEEKEEKEKEEEENEEEEKEEEEEELKPLSNSEIKYFEEHAGKWKIPTIKIFIDGYKHVTGGNTELQYKYVSKDENICTVTVVENNNGGLIKREHVCVKKVTKWIKEDSKKGKKKKKKETEDVSEKEISTPLTKSEIKYFKEHGGEWKIPKMKTFISGHKTVKDGQTVTEYMYVSDEKNCTVTVVEPMNSNLIKIDWSCVKNKTKRTKRKSKKKEEEKGESKKKEVQKKKEEKEKKKTDEDSIDYLFE